MDKQEDHKTVTSKEPRSFLGLITGPFAPKPPTKKMANATEEQMVNPTKESSGPDISYDMTEPDSDSDSSRTTEGQPHSFSPASPIHNTVQSDNEETVEPKEEAKEDGLPKQGPDKPAQNGSFWSMFAKPNKDLKEESKDVVSSEDNVAKGEDDEAKDETEDVATAEPVSEEKKEEQAAKRTSWLDAFKNKPKQDEPVLKETPVEANDAPKDNDVIKQEEEALMTPTATAVSSPAKKGNGMFGFFFKKEEAKVEAGDAVEAQEEAVEGAKEDQTLDGLTEVATEALTPEAEVVHVKEEILAEVSRSLSITDNKTNEPGFFGKLFGPSIKEQLSNELDESSKPEQQQTEEPALEAHSTQAEEASVEETEVDHMYQSAKENVESTEAAIVDEEEATESADDKCAATNEEKRPRFFFGLFGGRNGAETKEEAETVVEESAHHESKRGSLYLDTKEDIDSDGAPAPETEESELIVGEEEEVPMEPVVQLEEMLFSAEETGLELELEPTPAPLEDPYWDDNQKDQKEKMCCSFLFC